MNSNNSVSELVSRRLISIDAIRGMAVIAVVLMHVPHDAPGGWRENIWFLPSFLMDFGYLGVPMFVIISGFCIHRRAAIMRRSIGRWQLHWGEFWLRRFWRLYPPYVAAMCVSIVAALFVHDKHPDIRQYLVADTASHLLMVHNLTHEFSGGMGNGAFWSLGMEEQLYGLYFILLVAVRRKYPVAWIAGLATLLWRVLIPLMPVSESGDLFRLGSWGLWPFAYWFHWTLGAVAVDAYFENRQLPRWTESTSCGLFLLTFGLLGNRIVFELMSETSALGAITDRINQAVPYIHTCSELIVGLGFFCIMRRLIRQEPSSASPGTGMRVLATVGRASYSIYLIHVPVIYILLLYRPAFGNTGLSWAIRTIVFFGASLAAGFLFYMTVEKHFLSGRTPAFFARRNPEGRTPS